METQKIKMETSRKITFLVGLGMIFLGISVSGFLAYSGGEATLSRSELDIVDSILIFLNFCAIAGLVYSLFKKTIRHLSFGFFALTIGFQGFASLVSQAIIASPLNPPFSWYSIFNILMIIFGAVGSTFAFSGTFYKTTKN